MEEMADLTTTTTYHIQDKTVTVESVFNESSAESIASILLKLMLEDVQ